MPYIPQSADPFYIPNPKSGMHYRWISDSPDKLGLWLRSYGDRPGYALVQGPTVDDTKRIAKDLGLNEQYVVVSTNRIAFGQNILAAIPRTEHDRRVGEQVKDQRDKLASAKEAFHEAGSELPGIRTFEDHPDNLDDKKAFALREDRPVSGQAGVGTSPALRRKGTA